MWPIGVYVENAAELMEMSFGILTHVDPKNHMSDEGQDWLNPFAATSCGKTAMRPFAKLL